MRWGEWSSCSSGSRRREQVVLQEAVGAGAVQCPDPAEETEECYDCEVAWGSWSSCADGKRSRTQIILSEAIGAGIPCEDPITETQSQ